MATIQKEKGREKKAGLIPVSDRRPAKVDKGISDITLTERISNRTITEDLAEINRKLDLIEGTKYCRKTATTKTSLFNASRQTFTHSLIASTLEKLPRTTTKIGEFLEKVNGRKTAKRIDAGKTDKDRKESADGAATNGGGRPRPSATVFGRTPKGATPPTAAPVAAPSRRVDVIDTTLPSLEEALGWKNKALNAPLAPRSAEPTINGGGSSTQNTDLEKVGFVFKDPRINATWLIPLLVTAGLVAGLLFSPSVTMLAGYEPTVVLPVGQTFFANGTIPLMMEGMPDSLLVSGTSTPGAMFRVLLVDGTNRLSVIDTTETGKINVTAGEIIEGNESTTFLSACFETCALLNWSNSSLLEVTVVNGSVTIGNVSYTPAKIIVSENHAPAFISGTMNWTISANDSLSIELGPYFTDTDGDALTFVATDNPHFNVTVSGTTLTITAFSNWTGTDSITVIASDGKELTRGNATVTVKRESTENELVVANSPFYVEEAVADEIDAAGEAIVIVEMDLKATKHLTRGAENGALEARTAKDEIISARENVLKGRKKAGKSEEAGALAEDGIS
ncbi:MAG: Ig-like domain-containing protein, partial [Nanoarchaeota archaeon]